MTTYPILATTDNPIPTKKMVKCLRNNAGAERELVVGQIYQVEKEDPDNYWVVGNRGSPHWLGEGSV